MKPGLTAEGAEERRERINPLRSSAPSAVNEHHAQKLNRWNFDSLAACYNCREPYEVHHPGANVNGRCDRPHGAALPPQLHAADGDCRRADAHRLCRVVDVLVRLLEYRDE